MNPFQTEPIEAVVAAGTPLVLRHGLGRQVQGWLCIWRDAACDFHIQDPAADSSKDLVLVPSGSATVRLVLF